MNNMQVTIHQASKADLDILTPIYLEYCENTDRIVDSVDTEQSLSICLSSQDTVFYYAEINKKVVGFIYLDKLYSAHSKDERWNLMSIFVSETYRRQGIANNLIDTIKESATIKGNISISVHSLDDSLVAQIIKDKFDNQAGILLNLKI